MHAFSLLDCDQEEYRMEVATFMTSFERRQLLEELEHCKMLGKDISCAAPKQQDRIEQGVLERTVNCGLCGDVACWRCERRSDS